MIKTSRVLLRPVKSGDKILQYEYEQNVEIFTLQASKPRITTESSIDKWFTSATEGSPNLSAFALEVEGKYIGYCTIRRTESDFSDCWYGIVIGNQEYWGKGYGLEVTKAIIDYVFLYLGGRRIGLVTNSKNERAIRCFKKAGYVEEGRLRERHWIKGSYADSVYMSILKQEWIPSDPLSHNEQTAGAQ